MRLAQGPLNYIFHCVMDFESPLVLNQKSEITSFNDHVWLFFAEYGRSFKAIFIFAYYFTNTDKISHE